MDASERSKGSWYAGVIAKQLIFVVFSFLSLELVLSCQNMQFVQLNTPTELY